MVLEETCFAKWDTLNKGLRRSPCLGKIVDPGRIELEDLDDHKGKRVGCVNVPKVEKEIDF